MRRSLNTVRLSKNGGVEIRLEGEWHQADVYDLYTIIQKQAALLYDNAISWDELYNELIKKRENEHGNI